MTAATALRITHALMAMCVLGVAASTFGAQFGSVDPFSSCATAAAFAISGASLRSTAAAQRRRLAEAATSSPRGEEDTV